MVLIALWILFYLLFFYFLLQIMLRVLFIDYWQLLLSEKTSSNLSFRIL